VDSTYTTNTFSAVSTIISFHFVVEIFPQTPKMKFSTFLSLLAVAGSSIARIIPEQNAFASPIALAHPEASNEALALEARQIDSDSPTIRWVNSLNGGVRSLKLAIKQFNGNIEAIRKAELDLNQDMGEGNQKISTFGNYGVAEATLIFSELSKLQNIIEDLVYDAVNKRSLFVRANKRYDMRFIFEREMEGFGKFIDTITYKTPEENRGLMIQVGNGIFAAWQKGAEAFRK
jgi:hypothetical protein